MVELAQGADHATLEPANATQDEYAHAISTAPNFFRSTSPSAALVPLERVQKLEVQMAILLHRI